MALALYRKYRPATFAEVVGQEHVTTPLMNAIDSGRINHAYLFSGPRGCGKTSSARILARSLNCEQGPTSTPCGVCGSCVSLAPDGPGSIDVMEIDAASHGGVDDARDLREKAFFAPVNSRYKIYIVDEAHMVSSQGFNALLKVVEEPPEFLVFVFATTEPEKVLPTIRSRTHHYPFRLVPPSTLRGLLERTCEAEGVTVEPTVFPLVVRAGGGSVRDSLSILDQLLAGAGPEGVTYRSAVGLLGVTDEALLDEALDALAASDAPGVFQAVDRVVEAGHDPRRFATDLLDRLRDLIVLEAVPEASDNGLLDCPPDRLDLMNRQAQALGPATLSRLADTVHEGLTEMRGTTAPRLLLELVCARMLLPATDGSAVATLQRLERLERRMSIAGEHAGRPEAAAPTPVREPVREAARPTPAPARVAEPVPAAPVPAPAAPAASAPAAAPGRPAYVRPSQARAAATAPAAAPATTAPEGDDGWPVTARPGARAASAPAPTTSTPPAQPTSPAPAAGEPAPAADRPGASAAPAPRPRPQVTESEPDVPLPPEPTDDEDWPQPTAVPATPRPTPAPAPAAASAPAADEPVQPASSPAPAPRAAAESAPSPRGGEPTPMVSATPPEPAGGDTELTTVDVRRIWPELQAVVKRHKRTTEGLMKSAQVHDLANGTLTLSFTSPALAKMMGEDLNREVLRQSVEELLGVRWKVQTIVDVPGQAPAGPPATPEAARAAAQAAETAEADELMAEQGEDSPAGGPESAERDPHAAALLLLRTQLGARPIED